MIEKIKKIFWQKYTVRLLAVTGSFLFSTRYAFAQEGGFNVLGAIAAGFGFGGGGAGAAVMNGVLWTLNQVLQAVFTFVQWLASLALWVAEEAIIIGVQVLSNIPIVEKGWEAARDLSNLFFIFILLVIAIATILRIESYGMKRLLPTLILVALFINFSLLLTTLIIQPTNYMGLWFLSLIQGDNDNFATSVAQAMRLSSFNNTGNLSADEAAKGLKKANNEFKKVMREPINVAQGQLALFIVLMASIIIFLVVIFIGLAIAVLVMLRTIVLLILIVLSPLAFLFHVLPATAGYAREWWQKLISQSLLLPAMLFFIWIGVELSKQLPDFVKFNPNNANPLFDPAFLYAFILVLFFLGAGLTAAQKLGAVGANTALRWGSRLGKGSLYAAGGAAAYITYRQVAHRAAESETLEELSAQKGIVGSTFGRLRQGLEGIAKPVKEVEMRQERYRRAYEEKHPEKKVENFLNMRSDAKQEAYLRDKETNLASFAKAVHDMPSTNVEEKVRKLEAQAQARKALEKDPDKLEKFDRTIQSIIAKDEKTLKAASESQAYNPKIMEGAIKIAKKDALKEGWEEKDVGVFLANFNDMPEDIAKAFIEAGKDEDMQKKIKAISDPAEREAFVKKIADLDKTKANAVLKVAPRFATDFRKTLKEAVRLIDFKEISKEEASEVKNEIVLHTTSEQREKILGRGDEVANDYLKGIEALDPIGHFARLVADEIEERGGNKAAANQIRNNPIVQGSHNLNA